jgi:hypothetical protein
MLVGRRLDVLLLLMLDWWLDRFRCGCWSQFRLDWSSSWRASGGRESRDARTEKTPIASEDSSGWSLDEVVSVPANFHDYSGGCPLLTNGMLDQDMVANDKRGQWSSSFVVMGNLQLL